MDDTPAPLSSQIDQARQVGYGDDDILDYLSSTRSDLAPKIKQARDSRYSSGDVVNYLKTSSATPAPIPGMEKLGGVAPGGAGVPPLYKGHMVPPHRSWDSPVDWQGTLSDLGATNEVQRNPVVNAVTNVLGTPARGVKQMGRGIARMAGSGPAGTGPSGRDVAGGTADIVEGGMQAATPLLPGSLAAAPGATLSGLVTGTGIGVGTEAGLNAMGVAPEYSRLGGDVAGFFAGGVGASAGNRLRARFNPKAALEQAKGPLMEEAAPNATPTRLAAGTQTQSDISGNITNWDQQADTAYKNLRAIASRPENTTRIQTGTTTSPVVDAQGNPITTPVFENIEGATDYRPVKAAAQPFIEQLERTIPLSQRDASPGLTALRQMTQQPDYVSLDTAMSDLSTIQDLARTQDHPALRRRANGIAAAIVPPLRSAVNDAVGQMGQEAVDNLAQGRLLTKRKYAAGDVMNSLPEEPVQLAQKLTSQGDRNVNLLQSVAQISPQSIPNLARAALEGIMKPTMTRQGYAQAQQQWNALGDQTKQILFPDPAMRSKLNNFFTTAAQGATDRAVGAITATGAMMWHHPTLGIATLLSRRKLADILMTPYGPDMLSQGMKTPVTSRLAPVLYQGVMGQGGQPPTPSPVAAQNRSQPSQTVAQLNQ
jgi:hypothetical protein